MMVMNVTSFAQFIHGLRDKEKMSQKDFGKFCGVGQTTIARAENYQRDPSKLELKSLKNIGDATGHSLHTLIGYIYPDNSEIDADALALAETFAQMTDEEQEFVRDTMTTIFRKRKERNK